jgi:hypothetical protein
MNINPAITMQNGIAPRGGASSVFVFLDEQKKRPFRITFTSQDLPTKQKEKTNSSKTSTGTDDASLATRQTKQKERDAFGSID